MKKRKIILIGGGGHCRSCIDVIEAEDKFEIAGIVDVQQKLGEKISGYKIIACDKDLPLLSKEQKYFLITIGQIKNPDKRRDMFKYLKKLKIELPVVVSPFAYVSKNSFIGEGTIIMHKAFLNAGAAIRKNCIINTGAIIEHDSIVNDHCHISVGSVVGGNCTIEEGTFVGGNSVIANNIQITGGVVIGAGAIVVKSITKRGTYVGNTARRL
ncbi:MAG: acetyltransferase [Phycisphaerae bacterium]|jgi:tetrahydrodipicolinate N-succinyltransferase